MAIVALRDIIAIMNSPDSVSRSIGGVIGVLIFPILFGLLARYCLRKGKGA